MTRYDIARCGGNTNPLAALNAPDCNSKNKNRWGSHGPGKIIWPSGTRMKPAPATPHNNRIGSFF
jgi:hypothetical protein